MKISKFLDFFSCFVGPKDVLWYQNFRNVVSDCPKNLFVHFSDLLNYEWINKKCL